MLTRKQSKGDVREAVFVRAMMVCALALALPADAVRAQCETIETEILVASSTTTDDRFGYSVSISGNMAIVGAFLDDPSGTNSGSARMFRFDGIDWHEEDSLMPSDTNVGDGFGYSVSIHGDVAIVGAIGTDDGGTNSGSAYIFRFDGLVWKQEAQVVAANPSSFDSFGCSVSIHNDVAIVGSIGDDELGLDSGSATVFRHNGSSWDYEATLRASDGEEGDFFGDSVAVRDDVALVGVRWDDDNGTDSGAAFVFRFDDTTWNEEVKLPTLDGEAGDWFGFSVALSDDVALVGVRRDNDNGTNSGSAVIYRFDGAVWTEEAKLLAADGGPGDSFGLSVAISGDMVVVGAVGDDDNGFNAGATYVFRFDSAFWNQEAKLIASDGAAQDFFGSAVGISDNLAIVGAAESDQSGTDSGSAYVFAGLSDCNGNVTLDLCDIAEGESRDSNENGLPDECECPQDLDGDGMVDASDLAQLIGSWGPYEPCPPFDAADFNEDCGVNAADLAQLLGDWGPCS